jgi:hypothetical protein
LPGSHQARLSPRLAPARRAGVSVGGDAVLSSPSDHRSRAAEKASRLTARLAMRATHAPATSVRRPIRPNVVTDQPARGRDHSEAQIFQRRFVGQPIPVEFCAVIAPDRGDQQSAAAMGTDMSYGDGLKMSRPDCHCELH